MIGTNRRHLRNGLLFCLPWLIGLSVFVLYPAGAALVYSFTDYSTLQPPVWVGTENYRALADDELFYRSLANTGFYVGLLLPILLIVSLGAAILLSTGVVGQGVFRALLYLPSLMPAVAGTIVWLWILNGRYGILNAVLGVFGIDGPAWTTDPGWTKPALVIMGAWGMGTAMVIYIAALQDVPKELYEAAEIDGAGWMRKVWHVAVPYLSPVIYFNLIVGIIATVQVFTPAYIIGRDGIGRPERSLLFYALYLWQQAFEFLNMGYACAMAYVLLVVTVVLTLLAHRIAGRRVFHAT